MNTFEKFKHFEISKEEADQVKGGAWCFNYVNNNGQSQRMCRTTEDGCNSVQETVAASPNASLVGPCESTYVQ